MTRKEIDWAQVCRDIEDHLLHRLLLTLLERGIYYHLLRHTRVEGRRRLPVSMARLGRDARVSGAAARIAVHSLVQKGAVRICRVSKRGHVLQPLLPREILDCRRDARPPAPDLETLNFFKDRALRWAIHRRDGGRCFYCLRKLNAHNRMLDHVQPQVLFTRADRGAVRVHSYRNLVSCCPACNYTKREMPAAKFLRRLFRSGHLDREEFSERLRALKSLARGEMKPVLEHP